MSDLEFLLHGVEILAIDQLNCDLLTSAIVPWNGHCLDILLEEAIYDIGCPHLLSLVGLLVVRLVERYDLRESVQNADTA